MFPPRSPLLERGIRRLVLPQLIRLKAARPVSDPRYGPVQMEALIAALSPPPSLFALRYGDCVPSRGEACTERNRAGSGAPTPGTRQSTVRSTMREACCVAPLATPAATASPDCYERGRPQKRFRWQRGLATKMPPSPPLSTDAKAIGVPSFVAMASEPLEIRPVAIRR